MDTLSYHLTPYIWPPTIEHKGKLNNLISHNLSYPGLLFESKSSQTVAAYESFHEGLITHSIKTNNSLLKTHQLSDNCDVTNYTGYISHFPTPS